jgi:hypothetical protein
MHIEESVLKLVNCNSGFVGLSVAERFARTFTQGTTWLFVESPKDTFGSETLTTWLPIHGRAE